MAFEAPEQLNDVEAAAFFYPFHLAHLGLHERGHLAAGRDRARPRGRRRCRLGRRAAGGRRRAARHRDRSATTSKVALVRRLGADLVVNYRTDDFVARVLDATSGAGVDVCFDGVGGETMMQSLRCLARGGRHLVVGLRQRHRGRGGPDGVGAGPVLRQLRHRRCDPRLSRRRRRPARRGVRPRPGPPLQPAHGGDGPSGPGPPARAPGRRSHPPDRRPASSRSKASRQALDDMESRTTVGRIVVTRG